MGATDWAAENRPWVLAGAVLLLVGLVVVARWARNGNQAAAYRWLAGAVALALSAEGMWEVATEAMHLDAWKAALLFAFAELAMLNEARRAKKQVDRGAGPGVHGAAVWVIALGAGATAASNATSVAETLIRLFAPTLIAWQWWSDLTDDRESSSRWVWTPERIGVRVGLLKPGSGDDLEEVFRQRRVNKMVKLADRLDLAKPTSRRATRIALRLRRMAAADPGIVADAADRFRQGDAVQTAIFGRVRVAVTHPDDAAMATERRTPMAHPDADLTRVADAVMTHPVDAPMTQPGDAVRQVARTAVTRLDAPPARRSRELVMRRPVSAPPASDADRDAAIRDAVDAVLTHDTPIRGAARDAGIPEATVRRAVTRAKAELAPAINGHDHSQN